jgi:small nuclear ribonucleoprotein (snRNP)-like protein
LITILSGQRNHLDPPGKTYLVVPFPAAVTEQPRVVVVSKLLGIRACCKQERNNIIYQKNQTNHHAMLPLGLLTAAQGQPILVELKNGETLNGHLVNCDTWMNLTLKEVVQTSPEGDRFFRLAEAYVRGNNVR